MKLDVQSYPLAWPPSWPRTAPSDRKPGKFYRSERVTQGTWTGTKKLPSTIADSVNRLYRELRMMRVPLYDTILSTNNPLNQNGHPRGDREPVDPGAAVYWLEDGQQMCLAIDIYDELAHNLAALAATLEYMRGIERHGGATVMSRTFVGLKALPATTLPSMTDTSAAEIVAGYSADISFDAILTDRSVAKDAVQRAKRYAHPDNNDGAREKWDAVEAAARVLSSHHSISL